MTEQSYKKCAILLKQLRQGAANVTADLQLLSWPQSIIDNLYCLVTVLYVNKLDYLSRVLMH